MEFYCQIVEMSTDMQGQTRMHQVAKWTTTSLPSREAMEKRLKVLDEPYRKYGWRVCSDIAGRVVEMQSENLNV